MTTDTKQLELLLKQARKMLNAEFLQKSAYSVPTVGCDAAWLSKGLMLPYPPVVSFPTDKDVIARALELYNASNPAPVAPLINQNIATEEPESVPENPDNNIIEIVPYIDITNDEIEEDDTVNIDPTPEAISEPIASNPQESDVQIMADEIMEIYSAPTPTPELLPDYEMPEIEQSTFEEEVQKSSRLRSLLSKFMSTATELENKNKGNADNV